MNRKSVIRARRKEIMRLGKIVKEEILNRDDDGNLYPKKEWGYAVNAIVNGRSIYAADRNRFEAMYSCYDGAKWAAKQEPFVKQEVKEADS